MMSNGDQDGVPFFPRMAGYVHVPVGGGKRPDDTVSKAKMVIIAGDDLSRIVNEQCALPTVRAETCFHDAATVAYCIGK